MENLQTAFQIEEVDQVATALTELEPGIISLLGDTQYENVTAIEKIPAGHKIALKDIAEGEYILKYGVVIGKATKPIKKGAWVHLHCMCSLHDERSSHLDVVTGQPKDIKYE